MSQSTTTETTTPSDGSAETWDAIVIGAGQAGPGVAFAVAGQDKRVAVIEMDQVGGTCLNHGCRPTKALRASGLAAHRARRAADYGVQIGRVSVDFPAVMQRMHSMIDTMRESTLSSFSSESNIELIYDTATVHTEAGQPHQVRVGDRLLTTEKLYLDIGARAVIPPIDGLDDIDYLTEVELLKLTQLPERLIIVGGSYIGCEFGQMFRRFGSEVVILAGGGIAPKEDDDVSQSVVDLLESEGIEIVQAQAKSVAKGEDGGVVVTLDDGSERTGSQLLLATGRRPNIDLLGDDHGLELDDRGYLKIDSRFATSAPGVWALGDVNGHGAFTHTAYQDTQILLDENRSLDGRITAYAMFTDPPLGRVGMTEAEARESGRSVLKADLPMSSVSKAILDSETVGLMRILVEADSEEILGACFFGEHGDELAQQIGLAMQAGIGYAVVRDALPIHPTIAEFIPTLLGSVQPLDDDQDKDDES